MPDLKFDRTAVDAIFSEVDPNLPGVAIGISRDGCPIYRNAFGRASIELPAPLTPAMRLRIASMTKHFTCLAFLLLCEQGLASPDQRVGDYFPEFTPVVKEVKLIDLMGHTSGIRDVHDLAFQFNGTASLATVRGLVDLYRTIDTCNFAAGEAWSYCNGGYLILSLIIEHVSGKSLEQALEDLIFRPAGMKNTMLRRLDTDFRANSATLHMIDGRGGFERSYINKEHMGEGGVVSTIDDMLHWLGQFNHPAVGSDETWRLMRTSRHLNDGAKTGYGLGLTIGKYRGAQTIGHSGALMGCNSHMVHIPDEDLSIVVITNRHDISSLILAYRVLDVFWPVLEPIEELREVAIPDGTWRSPGTGRMMKLSRSSGDYLVVKGGGVQGAYIPDASGVLKPPPKARVGLDTIRYSAASNLLVVDDHGLVDSFEQLDRVSPQRLSPQGNFQAASVQVRAYIEQHSLSFTGPFGSTTYILEPIAPDVWWAKSDSPMQWGGFVKFDDAEGGFDFWTARTWGLRFERSR